MFLRERPYLAMNYSAVELPLHGGEFETMTVRPLTKGAFATNFCWVSKYQNVKATSGQALSYKNRSKLML